MDLKAMKSLLRELIQEQEELRRDNLKKLVQLKGRAQALKIVEQIAFLVKSGTDKLALRPLEIEDSSDSKKSDNKKLDYGKVTWKH